MEKVESFIRDLKERSQLQLEKYGKEKIERDAEEAGMLTNLLETAENLIQTRENISKNLNFINTNKHSIYKVIQDSETVKGLPISSEYQQQAMDFLTNSITFTNNFKDVQSILEVDKNAEVSNPTIDLVNSTRAIENELKKLKSSFIQAEALHSKVEQLKSTLFIPEGENHEDLDDSAFI